VLHQKRETKMSKNVLPPGATAPRSGEYELIGPRGGDTGKERTVVRGEPLPPTPKPGMGYRISRPAHNNAGKGK
jgi:hypothetical protein